jgi:hypothetical protein
MPPEVTDQFLDHVPHRVGLDVAADLFAVYDPHALGHALGARLSIPARIGVVAPIVVPVLVTERQPDGPVRV